jgi:hypothetical protein
MKVDEINAILRSEWMDVGNHKNGCIGSCRRELCDQFMIMDDDSNLRRGKKMNLWKNID